MHPDIATDKHRHTYYRLLGFHRAPITANTIDKTTVVLAPSSGVYTTMLSDAADKPVVTTNASRFKMAPISQWRLSAYLGTKWYVPEVLLDSYMKSM